MTGISGPEICRYEKKGVDSYCDSLQAYLMVRDIIPMRHNSRLIDCARLIVLRKHMDRQTCQQDHDCYNEKQSTTHN